MTLELGLAARLGPLALVAWVCACASPEAPSPPADGPVSRAREPIFHGTVDPAHQAVVAIFSDQSACSATLVQAEGKVAFALTAAHCCAEQDHPFEAILGASYDDLAALVFPVIGYQADPAYDGMSHDFCMLQLAAASPGAPVIPVMTPEQDVLEAGSVVTFVGYGTTETDPGNALRRAFTGPLAAVYPTTLAYDQELGGPCAGDSGGPSLSVLPGGEVVSGVTSYGDPACTSFGVSGRASAVYASFIEPFVAGAPAALTCAQCLEASGGNGPCVAARRACRSEPACEALLVCLARCAPGDEACARACPRERLPLGTAFLACACAPGCSAECAGDPACPGDPPGAPGVGGAAGHGAGAGAGGGAPTPSTSAASGGGAGAGAAAGSGAAATPAGLLAYGGCSATGRARELAWPGGALLGLLAGVLAWRRSPLPQKAEAVAFPERRGSRSGDSRG